MDMMLAEMPAEMLDEWMAYTQYEAEETEARQRRAADERKTTEQAKKNAGR